MHTRTAALAASLALLGCAGASDGPAGPAANAEALEAMQASLDEAMDRIEELEAAATPRPTGLRPGVIAEGECSGPHDFEGLALDGPPLGLTVYTRSADGDLSYANWVYYAETGALRVQCPFDGYAWATVD